MRFRAALVLTLALLAVPLVGEAPPAGTLPRIGATEFLLRHSRQSD
jgi:hypothetical protein